MRGLKVWLCGAEWTIRFVEDHLDGTTEGLTRYPQREIVVSQVGHPDAVRQTTIHEVLHAAHFTNGGKHHADEEDCVRSLERPLLTMLTDKRNRRFIDWLQGDE